LAAAEREEPRRATSQSSRQPYDGLNTWYADKNSRTVQEGESFTFWKTNWKITCRGRERERIRSERILPKSQAAL
jgi:hypothetical protein